MNVEFDVSQKVTPNSVIVHVIATLPDGRMCDSYCEIDRQIPSLHSVVEYEATRMKKDILEFISREAA